MKFLRLGVLLIAIDLLAAQQPQPASIEGVVVTLGSGEPLADATIQLDLQTKPDPSNPFDGDFSQKTHRFAHSDGAGRFAFENVSPGDYQLIAARSGGYVPGEYGQRTPTGNGIAFVLTAGQRMTGIRLASPTGSISGHVYDRNGESVGKAQVQALQPMYKNGHRKLTIIQIVQTNDCGEYRIVWLPPGMYSVSARPDITELPRFMGTGNSPPVSAVRIAEPSRYSTYEQGAAPMIKKRVLKTEGVIEELHVPVYYPGVVDAQTATAVPVSSGGTVGGIDFPVSAGTVPARPILGRVISGADGQRVPGAFVSAYPVTSDPLYSLPGQKAGSNGLFDIPRMWRQTPGSIRISCEM